MNMPILTQPSSTDQVTMSSLEIVDFINEYRAKNESNPVQLRHDSFMAKAPKVLGENQSPKFIGDYKDAKGRTYPCYYFPKREACLMAMSYSYELQAQIFDRMTAMEEALKKPAITLPDFTDPAEAAIAWANQYKATQAAQEQLELAAPKVQYFDRVADTKNLLNATQVGQKFGMSAIVLNKTLEKFKVYNQSVKRSRVFQQWFIDKGFGELKQTESGHPQSMFTTTGEQWIHEQFVSEGVI